jgi:hypothetical protein
MKLPPNISIKIHYYEWQELHIMKVLFMRNLKTSISY